MSIRNGSDSGDDRRNVVAITGTFVALRENGSPGSAEAYAKAATEVLDQAQTQSVWESLRLTSQHRKVLQVKF